MTTYACREHPGQPVTWKGTGCPLCDQQKRETHRRDDDEGYAQDAYPRWTGITR